MTSEVFITLLCVLLLLVIILIIVIICFSPKGQTKSRTSPPKVSSRLNKLEQNNKKSSNVIHLDSLETIEELNVKTEQMNKSKWILFVLAPRNCVWCNRLIPIFHELSNEVKTYAFFMINAKNCASFCSSKAPKPVNRYPYLQFSDGTSLFGYRPKDALKQLLTNENSKNN